MRTRLISVLAAVFSFAFVVLLSPLARADNKTLVVWVEGPDADRIRNMIADDAPEGVTVMDADVAKGALTKAGGKPPLQKTLDNAKNRQKLFDKLKKGAGAAKVDAFLFGSSKKAKGGTTVHLWLLTSDGEVSLDQDVALSKKKKDKDVEDAKLLGDAVNEPLKAIAPPPPPPPEPEPAPAEETKPAEEEKKDEGEEEEPGEARKKHDVAHSFFEIGGGADIGIRKLSFDNRLTNNIRGYSVTGAPGVFIAGEIYPGANGKGVLRDIGIIFDYAQALGLKSAPSGGDKLDTTWNRWEIGLRARIRTGGETSPIVGVDVAYGAENFSISTDDPVLSAQSPSAAYRFVRLGLDARIPFGVAAIFGGADFLVVNSAGDVSDRFTGTKMSGLAAHIGLGFTVMEGLEARLMARITHFGYAFNSNPGDTYIADGASDTLTSIMIGAAYVF